MTIDATEAQLVERAKRGDQHAFATLAEQHRARLWSICLRITGNRADAEDALQDALTASWLHLASFRSEARFGTWAYRIAANAALAVVRRRKDIPTDIVEELHADGGADFTRQVIDADRINAALATLGVQFREALVLREYGDLSYEQIAVHQGVGVQTVKSRLNRARAALAQELAGDEG